MLSDLVKHCRNRKACEESMKEYLFAEPVDDAAAGPPVSVCSCADRLSMCDSVLLS